MSAAFSERKSTAGASRLLRPFDAFFETEASSGIVLGAATVLALVWANTPWAGAYAALWDAVVTINLGVLVLSDDLRHWVNDGLMAVFFFVVALEIKRELVRGELADRRSAALPAVAAIGGMVIPAALYAALNAGTPELRGWGIPMATDIAFALGVLALLGRRAPAELRVLLLAIAIVDDVGAIGVIALFYTESLSPAALAAAGALVAAVLALQRAGVRVVAVYVVVGAALWLAVHKSGIHATIAGVVLGFLTPARPHRDPGTFPESVDALLGRYREAIQRGDDEEAGAVLDRLETLSRDAEAPLERLERRVHPWASYGILPLFALANAGLELSVEGARAAATSPVTLGITLGLVAGKLVGVTGGAWVAVRLGWAALPRGVGWTHVTGIALLAGIGFTVSLFIAALAFGDAPAAADSKIGIFAGSVLAGLGGYVVLRRAWRASLPAGIREPVT